MASAVFFARRTMACCTVGLALLISTCGSSAALTTLMGTITDVTNNTPNAGVFVVAFPNSYLPYAAYTDADGRYALSLAVVDPGVTHYLVLTKTGYASYAETDPPEIIQDQVNTKNAGMYIGSLITGYVKTFVSSSPIPGAIVSVRSNDAGNCYAASTVTASDGAYALRQPPGTSGLYVSHPDYASLPTRTITLEDKRDAPGVDFAMRVGNLVAGHVRYSGNTLPAAGITVVSVFSDAADYLPQSVTWTASDGSYTLAHVYPGLNHLIAYGPTGWGNAIRYNIAVPDQSPPVTGIDLMLPVGGNLSGSVHDFLNQPVADAEVTVFPANGNSSYQQKVRTDASGTYEFLGLAVGEYAIQVKPPQGFNLQAGEYSGLAVAAGSLLTRHFMLQPGGQIQGAVLGCDGSPVADATVDVSLDMRYPFEKLVRTQTDALGEYAVDGLSPFQNYTVTITPPASRTRLNAAAVAKHLTVSENTIRRQDFRLQPSGGRQGSVADPNGAPMGTGSVIAINAEAAVSADFQADGRYLLSDAPAGEYLCIVQSTAAGVPTITDYIHVTPGVLAAVDYQFPEGAVIEGYVYDAAGNSLSGVKVTANNKMDLLASMPFFDKTSYTDSVGHYRLEGLAAGTYTLQASPSAMESGGMAGRQVRALAVAEQARLRQDFHLSAGAKVHGLLRDTHGNRLYTGMVMFWSEDQPENSGFTMADQWGNYSVMLAPGAYHAQGFFTSMLGVNLAVEPLAAVTVPGNLQCVQQEFVMPSGGAILGQVTDALGQPLTLALVEAYQLDSPLPVQISLTNAQGGYQIAGLHTGVFRVAARKSGFSSAETVAAVQIGEQTDGVDLALVAQTSIGGIVLGPDRKPLPQAVIQALGNGGVIAAQTGSDADGNYSLASLAPGDYHVKASATGMKSQLRSGLQPGDRADFNLEPLISHEQAISYPNPCRERQVTFLYWLEEDATVLIRVYNQAGELVWDWEGPGQGQRYNRQLWQVEGVAPGVYLFKITARNADHHVRHFPMGKLTVIH